MKNIDSQAGLCANGLKLECRFKWDSVVVSVAAVSTSQEGHFLNKLLGSVRRPTGKQSMCTDHNTQETMHSFGQTEEEVGHMPDCTVYVYAERER